MSPVSRNQTPRQAKLKALNEITPKKKQSNIKVPSATPLLEKLDNLSITSPARNRNVSSPLNGSDSENFTVEKKNSNKRKSKSGKKKLPLMEVNQAINNEEPQLFASRSQSPASPFQEQMEVDVVKPSPKKRTPKKSASKANPHSCNEDYTVEAKSPLVLTFRRSVTPVRSLPVSGINIEKSRKEKEVEKPQRLLLEEEFDSGDEAIQPQRKGLEEEYESDAQASTCYGLEKECDSGDDDSGVVGGGAAKATTFLQPVSRLDFELMQEDAEQRAQRRRKREKNPLMKIYPIFHTSVLPDVLLNREEHCKEIERFIKQAIGPQSSVHNRSIYISGVPGTGKTACTTKVIQKLQKKSSPKFNYVYVNGLELVKPEHVFSEIYNALYPSNRKTASKAALDKLSKIFAFDDPKRLPILLVIDELDMLCTRSQDTLYMLFDWCSIPEARLSIIAIANTLDLPERVLKQRVSSRLGYNRIMFQPYNHEEIIHILEHRMEKKFGKSVNNKTFGFIARKVAAVSGDLRKALEFIRRAIEIAVDDEEEVLTMKHATAAVNEGLQSLPTLMTQSLSSHQQVLLRSIVQETRATSMEELDYYLLYECYRRNCLALAMEPMEMSHATGSLMSLQNMGYVDVKGNSIVSRRIALKISVDEIDFLLRQLKAGDAA